MINFFVLFTWIYEVGLVFSRNPSSSFCSTDVACDACSADDNVSVSWIWCDVEVS